MIKPTLAERMWKGFTREPDGCWMWRRKLSSGGYGRTKVGRKDWAAHRLVYTLIVGPIPEGLELDHLCRNRACVNPSHLEPVTHYENGRRSPIAYGRAKTACPNGHEYTPENTAVRKGKWRECLTCRRARKARHAGRG